MKTPVPVQKIFILLYFFGLLIYSTFDLVGGYQNALFEIKTTEKLILFGIVLGGSVLLAFLVGLLTRRFSVRAQLAHWDGLMLGITTGFILDQISWLQFLPWPNRAYSLVASVLFVSVFLRAVFRVSTPNGRIFLVFIVFAGLIAKLNNQKNPSVPKDDIRPNLILLTIDGLNAEIIQDVDVQKLRSISFLAHNGISFQQMYSASHDPITSYQTLLTAKLPSQKTAEDVPPNFAQWFGFLGYTTAGFVSSSIFDERFQRGFRYFDDEFSCLRGWSLWFGGRLVPCSVGGRSSAQTTSLMLDWMDAQKGPFFSWITFSELQGEYTPPVEWNDHFYTGDPFEHHSEECMQKIASIHLQKAAGRCSKEWMLSQYKGEIASLDASLQQILSWIEEHPNTMLVVMGGYGQHLADKEPWFGRDYMTTESTHIPALIWFPSILPKEKQVTSIVSSMDVLPTVFDVFGIAFEGRVDGTSLVPEIYSGEGNDYILGVDGAYKRFVLERETKEWTQQIVPR